MPMHEIVPFVFLGDANDALAVDSRDASCEHIRRVLTLANVDPAWKGALKNKLKSFIVDVADLPGEDLLTRFPECVAFIHEAVSAEESVLVHCSYGLSRSPTVVVAYLMWARGTGCREGLEQCQRIRPGVHPNPGFAQQLRLWGDMQCRLSSEHKAFRVYRLRLWTEEMRQNGYCEALGLAPDPTTAGPARGKAYKCRKCRRVLLTEESVLQHELGQGQESFKWLKRNEVLQPPSSSASLQPQPRPSDQQPRPSAMCTSLFTEPIEWMGPLIVGSLVGLVTCPKCDCKLGSFNWAGSQCSCGKWVVPSFQLHKNKID